MEKQACKAKPQKHKRKQLSKKTRFDVFKRDKFQCGYCGRTPPDVVLEVDHITPVADGGTNQVENLFTACFDCNRGKGAIPLTVAPANLQSHIEIVEEKENQITAHRKFLKKIAKREKKDIEHIAKIYSDNVDDYVLSDVFKNYSLRIFIQKLPLNEIENAMYIALGKMAGDKEGIIRYFCGVCWCKIREGQL